MAEFKIIIGLTNGASHLIALDAEASGIPSYMQQGLERLAPSSSYDVFCNGIISKRLSALLGKSDSQNYRALFSQPITHGQSWTLGMFIAHACDQLNCLLPHQDIKAGDHFIWATGEMSDQAHLPIAPVQNIEQKLTEFQPIMDDMIKAGATLTLCMADANAGDVPHALQTEWQAKGARFVFASDGASLLQKLNLLPQNNARTTDHKKYGTLILGTLITGLCLAALALYQHFGLADDAKIASFEERPAQIAQATDMQAPEAAASLTPILPAPAMDRQDEAEVQEAEVQDEAQHSDLQTPKFDPKITYYAQSFLKGNLSQCDDRHLSPTTKTPLLSSTLLEIENNYSLCKLNIILSNDEDIALNLNLNANIDGQAWQGDIPARLALDAGESVEITLDQLPNKRQNQRLVIDVNISPDAAVDQDNQSEQHQLIIMFLRNQEQKFF
ncbi:MAG: hypothetical protein AB8B77_03150 [Alphaproteobacteria bacterium]